MRNIKGSSFMKNSIISLLFASSLIAGSAFAAPTINDGGAQTNAEVRLCVYFKGIRICIEMES